jgi:hypothetical protein
MTTYEEQSQAVKQYAETITNALNALTSGSLTHARNGYLGNIVNSLQALNRGERALDKFPTDKITESVRPWDRIRDVYRHCDEAVGWMTRIAHK